jgi:Protein of unknown function (DUF559)
MRRNPTPSEHALWQALRGSKLGVKFRRQHVLAPFIVDFYAASLRLVIEVDGSAHEGREARDASRTAKLVALDSSSQTLAWRLPLIMNSPLSKRCLTLFKANAADATHRPSASPQSRDQLVRRSE